MKLTRNWIRELEEPFPDESPSKEEALSDIEDALVKCMAEETPRGQVIRLLRNGLWLLYRVEQEALKEARKSQTMFFFLGDFYGIALKGEEKTHFQWVQEQRLAGSYYDMVLGHYDDIGIYLYTPQNHLAVHKLRLPRIIQQCQHLIDDREISVDLQVFNGGEKFGSLKELLLL